jgi:hypothetical protein
MFFVRTPRGDGEAEALEAYARSLGDSLEDKDATDPRDQYRLNAFLRWAMDGKLEKRIEPARADRLMDEVRAAVPSDFDEPAH